MQIVFIGTGGGRVNLVKQFRGTGGFRINTSALNVHVDPGPGALVGSNFYRQDPTNVGLLFVSHAHIDHSNDANLMIEAMSGFALKKKGVLVGSSSVVKGDRRFGSPISKYHLGKLEKNVALKPGGSFSLKGVGIRATKTKHDDRSAVGFVLEAEGKRVGYTSDTEYFKGLGAQYGGCDYLIVNNLKPRDDGIPDHLASEDTVKILKEAKPKKAILSHLGAAFLKRPAEVEAQTIAEESGVQTIASRDGMKLGDLGQFQKVYRLDDFGEDDNGPIKIQQGNREKMAGEMGSGENL
jgi:phosphoribosyl 1,2-cyclic phosphodiesterase